jgi:hypothetical protein
MLPGLIERIECAIISYIKSVEYCAPSEDLNTSIVSLVARSSLLSKQRKSDILVIDKMLDDAKLQQQTAICLVRDILIHVNTMRTGFLFFSGKSKLRDNILQAIEQYDLKYIAWKKGAAILSDASGSHANLKGHRNRLSIQQSPLWEDKEDQLGPVQQQIEHLVKQMDDQKKQIEENKSSMDFLKDTLIKTQGELEQSKLSLSSALAENIQLREALNRVSEGSNKTPEGAVLNSHQGSGPIYHNGMSL